MRRSQNGMQLLYLIPQSTAEKRLPAHPCTVFPGKGLGKSGGPVTQGEKPSWAQQASVSRCLCLNRSQNHHLYANSEWGGAKLWRVQCYTSITAGTGRRIRSLRPAWTRVSWSGSRNYMWHLEFQASLGYTVILGHAGLQSETQSPQHTKKKQTNKTSKADIGEYRLHGEEKESLCFILTPRTWPSLQSAASRAPSRVF